MEQRKLIIIGAGAVAAYVILKKKPFASVAASTKPKATTKLGTSAGPIGVGSSNLRPSTNIATGNGVRTVPAAPSNVALGAAAIGATGSVIGDLIKFFTAKQPSSQPQMMAKPSGGGSGSGGSSGGSTAGKASAPGKASTAYDPWSDPNNYDPNGCYIGDGAWDDNGNYVGNCGSDPTVAPAMPVTPTVACDNPIASCPIDIYGMDASGNEPGMDSEMVDPCAAGTWDPSQLPGASQAADMAFVGPTQDQLTPGSEGLDGGGNLEDAFVDDGS